MSTVHLMGRQKVSLRIGGSPTLWLGLLGWALVLAGQTAAAQEPTDGAVEPKAPALSLPAANNLDRLGLDDVARAQGGAWSDFFVENQPNPEIMATVPAPIAGLASQAQASYSQADFPACLAQSREVLRMLPDFPPSLLVYGTAAFRLRRYGDCRIALDRFREVAPSEVWRTQVLGHALYSLGEFEAARDHYLAVMESAPDPRAVSLGARRGLALASYRMGKTADALLGLNGVVLLAPGDAEAHAWIAQVHFDLEQLDDALSAARKAMQLAPYEPRAYFLAYRALFEMADLAQTDEAAQAFESEAQRLQAKWVALSAAASEINTLHNRLLFHVGDPALLRALANQHKALGDIPSLIQTLESLIDTSDSSDPTTLTRRIFAMDSLRAVGADDQADALKAATTELFPGVEGLPE